MLSDLMVIGCYPSDPDRSCADALPLVALLLFQFRIQVSKTLRRRDRGAEKRFQLSLEQGETDEPPSSEQSIWLSNVNKGYLCQPRSILGLSRGSRGDWTGLGSPQACPHPENGYTIGQWMFFWFPSGPRLNPVLDPVFIPSRSPPRSLHKHATVLLEYPVCA
jgi:hypothetical protein